jgi:hypothetical protein
MTKTCWNCKHDILKLKVLVPHDHTIREYVHRTSDFQSDIVAVVKEKQGQYIVWFRSGRGIELVTFKMLHICKLRIEGNPKQATCHCFTQNGELMNISNIIYSKEPAPEVGKEEIAIPTAIYAST